MFIVKKAPFSKTTDSATQPKQKHVRKNNKRQKVLSGKISKNFNGISVEDTNISLLISFDRYWTEVFIVKVHNF